MGKFDNRMGLSIEHMIDCCLEYGENYVGLFGSQIADDGVLGEEIKSVLQAARGLLNGPLGRADGATVDRRILNAATYLGYDVDDGTW